MILIIVGSIFSHKNSSQEDNYGSIIIGCPHSSFGRRGHLSFAILPWGSLESTAGSLPQQEMR